MLGRIWIVVSVLLLAVLLLAACGQVLTPQEPVGDNTDVAPSEAAATEESLDYVWNQLLSRDSILPIYDPEFVPANEAGYDDNELVMGVEIGGVAKAYPRRAAEQPGDGERRGGWDTCPGYVVTAMLYRSRV